MWNNRLKKRTDEQPKNWSATADRMQKTHLEIGVTHHDAEVTLKTGHRETLSEGLGDHKVSA